MNMKNFKKNQVVIFVIALMLVTAGYLNFTNGQNTRQDLIPTSSLADSEQMASIGDATLVNANQTNEENLNKDNSNKTNTEQNIQVSTNNVTENQASNNVNETSSTNTTPKTEDSYFTQSRLDRDNMYSQMLENYQKILEADNLDTVEKTNAQTEIKNINNQKNAIMIAENLIKTKGFEDVLLFMNNGNVSVIVKTDKLDEDKIAQIQNIITRELNVKVNKINVSMR